MRISSGRAVGIFLGKAAATLMAFLLILLLIPAPVPVAAAGAASFSISGPSTLAHGQVGTFIVKAAVYDAAAAQAKLVYDASFFEYVSGNLQGLWDSASNTDTTATLTSVNLRCIAAPGSSGVLSLTGAKASRLTGSLDNPSQSVPVSVTPKTVTNPVPTVAPTTAPTTTRAATQATTAAPATTKTSAKPTPTVAPTAAGPTAAGPATAGPATAAPTAPPATAPVSTVPGASGPATSEPAAGSATTGTGAAGSAASGLPAPSSGESWASPSAIPESWLSIRERLAVSQAASLVVRPENPEVPAFILQKLKDTQATLTLDFSSYTCRIDGSLLNRIPLNPATLNLSLSLSPDPELVRVSGGNALYQLHFQHEGQLPGRFAFSFKATQNKPGDTVYLYTYYEQAGVMQGIQAATVDARGFVTFDFFHSSSYFVSGRVISGAVNGFATAGQSGSGGAAGTGAGGAAGTDPGVQVVQLVIGMLAAALTAALATMYRFRVGLFKQARIRGTDETLRE